MTITPTLADLRAFQEMTNALLQESGRVHRLVEERIDALAEAYGRYEHPLETRRQYAERVLAKGQYPFPVGESIYDDLNNNTAYDFVTVGYGLPEDGEARITFTGWYPHWAEDGESYERRRARIHCPAWLIAGPDGDNRFREQTAEMVAAVKAEREREDAAIDAAIERALAS